MNSVRIVVQTNVRGECQFTLAIGLSFIALKADARNAQEDQRESCQSFSMLEGGPAARSDHS